MKFRCQICWGKTGLGLGSLTALVVIALLLQWIGEEFPFSNFPMYSNLSTKSDYLYLTNEEDQPLGCQSIFNLKTDVLKKMYNARLKELKGKSLDAADGRRQAGRKTLADLSSRQTEKVLQIVGVGGLRLYRVELTRTRGKIDSSTELLVEIPSVKRDDRRGE